ncbi:MAG: diaminopropionate ammonia-lyase [Firmicutes bacterium]|nr:diaminopropionate ammonia-lyase [Bacillota bacterium]MDD3297921.1 diaminopropionate ammonia-lyase [Bacillota bacterium]MDD3850579.1 diaminopropionate ammonia-lyase [Bacillota bacterium]MDD4707367.1 diaminopropionate ammonia-lyase [Bacillota bacterium]
MSSLQIEYIFNKRARKDNASKVSVGVMSKEEMENVREFHKSFSEYRVTPLHELDNLAGEFKVEKIWVKDEAYRFGLNAFKVLGGSLAIGKYLGQRLGKQIEELTFEKLRSKEVKEQLGDITFVTATDGNHGRGIAWAARQLRQKSVVFMPKGSSEIRLENIKREGAQAYITDYNYDDAVRYADQYAKQHGDVVVQDTAWEGYEDIPLWIMQGYGTLIDEAIEQIEALGQDKPTHVFLQVGVGSFAGAVQGYLASKYGGKRPVTVIVEPSTAACIYKSAKANDGKPHAVEGDLTTIMSGLACGVPNTISWEILRDYSDMYVACPDYVAARGVRILASPLKEDPQIVSGESGAVGLGLLSLLMEKEALKEMKGLLKINEESKVLLISTEGDTDPADYRRIVWDGAFPSR